MTDLTLEQRDLLSDAVRITRTEYSTGIATTIAEAVMDQPPGTYWIISEESLAALQAQQPGGVNDGGIAEQGAK